MTERPLPQHVLDAIERGHHAESERLGFLAPRPSAHDGKGLASIFGGDAQAEPKRGRIRVAPKPERTAADGTVFASKRELVRYQDLKILQQAGHVRFFLRQVPFHLPGGVKYLLDFLIFWSDGRTTCEDVKGMKTEMYRLKKKQVEALYPVKIEEP